VQPELRQMVFERDNYTCQRCGFHKDDFQNGIHCHHIESLNENPIESADIDNCITLCEGCHKEVHSISGCKYNELRCLNA
jgi:5-methylcytosine-specific restriction endonuclease McrA